MKRLLVPIDGSECSQRALAVAIDLAKTMSAGLLLVHVVDTARAAGLTFGEPQLVAGYLDSLNEEGKRLLDESAHRAREAGCEVSAAEIATGSPAAEIDRLAAEGDIAMTVMGSHGRTGVNRAFMGSVAEEVTRRSPVPVVIVPAGCTVSA